MTRNDRGARRRLSCLLALGASFVTMTGASRDASATLTSVDEAEMREDYAHADKGTAAHVRATIARPDVPAEEAQTVFANLARGVPFDERHAAFMRALLFGPASEAARNDLVPAVVAGLLARSADVAGGAAAEAARGAELIRIHRFVALEIGAAGKPPREGHDASLGLRDDALRAAAALYRAHLALPLLDRARVSGPLLAARAQAELALIELSSGLAPRTEVGSWLGENADTRLAFERTGLLVVGLEANAAKAKSVLSMLEGAAGGARDASLLWIDKPHPVGVAGRRRVLAALAPLSGSGRVDGSRLWSSSVEPGSPDAALAEVAFVLGRAAVTAALEASPAITEAAARMLDRVRRGGAEASVLAPEAVLEAPEGDRNGAALSAEGALSHAAELLLLDAPRATSMALVRALAGRPEAVEQLALAIGALAMGEDGKLRAQLELGRPGEGGLVLAAPVTQIRGAPERVTDFTLDGHAFTIGRDEAGAVIRVERDGKPITLGSIPYARVPTLGGDTWTSPGRGGRKPLALARLFGAPEVGFTDDAHFLLRGGAKPRGRDAIALKASANVSVEADLKPGPNAPSLVLLRAAATATGFSGVALVLEPGDELHASLVAFDGSGGAFPIAGPVTTSKVTNGVVHVRMEVSRDHVEAIVGGQTVSGQLPAPLASASGDVAFAPGDKNELDVKNLKIGAPRR